MCQRAANPTQSESASSTEDPRPLAVPTVQVDNEHLIITEWRFAPGAHTGWHRHGYAYAVVPITAGTLRLVTPQGTIDSTLEIGRSYARPAGVEHDVINANDHEFVFVEIELKAAAG